jgi:hypothetical protein
MSLHKQLYSSTQYNVFILYILYILYSLRAAPLLWDLLKTELFYLDGTCQKCGSCCREVALFIKNENIDTKQKYQKLISKNSEYKVFSPVYNNSSDYIGYFICARLGEGQLCQDYACRFSFCRNFPASSFVKQDRLPQGCNFRLKLKVGTMLLKHRGLLRKIARVRYLEKKRVKNA